MPPRNYRVLHSGAKLTDDERATLREWAEGGPSTTAEPSGSGEGAGDE
jgi:hypothetical protein